MSLPVDTRTEFEKDMRYLKDGHHEAVIGVSVPVISGDAAEVITRKPISFSYESISSANAGIYGVISLGNDELPIRLGPYHTEDDVIGVVMDTLRDKAQSLITKVRQIDAGELEKRDLATAKTEVKQLSPYFEIVKR